MQLEFDVIFLTTFSVGKEGLAHVPFDLHVAPIAVTKRERIFKKKRSKFSNYEFQEAMRSLEEHFKQKLKKNFTVPETLYLNKTLFTKIHHNAIYICIGNGNPLQYSCLENSMDRAIPRATVHGAAKSQMRLSTSV